MDEIITVEILDDDDHRLSGVRLTIPRELLDQWISDFEDHLISSNDEAELL